MVSVMRGLRVASVSVTLLPLLLLLLLLCSCCTPPVSCLAAGGVVQEWSGSNDVVGGSSKQHTRRELVVGPREASQTPAAITPEQQNNTEVVAQVGGTASIKCYTHYLGDEIVTWTKRDMDQLLTAGGQVYSSEDRYSVAHVRHQKLWELSLRDVRKSDAGLYECQLTTHPPASLFFTLKVVEAVAVVDEGPEVHVHTGVKLRLHCRVEEATEEPQYIFWFHNSTMINYSQRRPVKVVKHNHQSTLLITNVTWHDAGTYRCEPHLATPANLTLHVLEGEKHAALHNGQQSEGADQDATADSAHIIPSRFLVGCCLLFFLRHHASYTRRGVDWS